jgi:hypothetical protein
MNRTIRPINGIYTCQQCQQPVSNQSKPHLGECRCALSLVRSVRAKPGLGDMVAAGLDAIGVTKERVQAVASKAGIKDCGCKKRQEALNNLGRNLGIG